jgi:hypothetical protein
MAEEKAKIDNMDRVRLVSWSAGDGCQPLNIG